MNSIMKNSSKNWKRFILSTSNMLKLLNSIMLISKVKCTSMVSNRKRKNNQKQCRINLKKVKIISLILGLMINLMTLWCFAPLKISSKKVLKCTFVTDDFPINFCFWGMESLLNTISTIIYSWELTSKNKHLKLIIFIT